MAVPWLQLTKEEQTKALAYKRILLSDKKPSRLMSDYINFLHDKYPDFTVASIPELK